jgi:hypothetical protein
MSSRSANVPLRRDGCDGWGDRDLYEISWIPRQIQEHQIRFRVFASDPHQELAAGELIAQVLGQRLYPVDWPISTTLSWVCWAEGPSTLVLGESSSSWWIA